MWYYLENTQSILFRFTDRLSLREWTVVFVAVIIAGAICLRGFGSRTNY